MGLIIQKILNKIFQRQYSKNKFDYKCLLLYNIGCIDLKSINLWKIYKKYEKTFDDSNVFYNKTCISWKNIVYYMRYILEREGVPFREAAYEWGKNG